MSGMHVILTDAQAVVEAVDALFNAFDPDNTGSIEYVELDNTLREGDPDTPRRKSKPSPMREACINAHFLLCRRPPVVSMQTCVCARACCPFPCMVHVHAGAARVAGAAAAWFGRAGPAGARLSSVTN